ncbi:hypothetical protein M3Y97_00357300 [Aphelenchoides bicaudatus]|nr:hypothetical protein M3Y97_00357300 [Aphelenchoides bicaudatus]
MPEEDNYVSDLMGLLGVGRPNNNVYYRMYDHDRDFDFIQSYLTEMRGPTHMPKTLTLRDTWRLGGICKNFESNLGAIHFLMVGLPTEQVYSAISNGLPKLASKKASFGGNGYYFTACSTKAANQCVSASWTYETHADRGILRPEDGQGVYIMFCEVALGRTNRTTVREKKGIGQFDNYDSLVLKGLYTHKGNQFANHKEEGYEVCIPRGPFFRNWDVRKISVGDMSYFFYDEFYVERPTQINPCMLARVTYHNRAVKNLQSLHHLAKLLIQNQKNRVYQPKLPKSHQQDLQAKNQVKLPNPNRKESSSSAQKARNDIEICEQRSQVKHPGDKKLLSSDKKPSSTTSRSASKEPSKTSSDKKPSSTSTSSKKVDEKTSSSKTAEKSSTRSASKEPSKTTESKPKESSLSVKKPSSTTSRSASKEPSKTTDSKKPEDASSRSRSRDPSKVAEKKPSKKVDEKTPRSSSKTPSSKTVDSKSKESSSTTKKPSSTTSRSTSKDPAKVVEKTTSSDKKPSSSSSSKKIDEKTERSKSKEPSKTAEKSDKKVSDATKSDIVKKPSSTSKTAESKPKESSSKDKKPESKSRDSSKPPAKKVDEKPARSKSRDPKKSDDSKSKDKKDVDSDQKAKDAEAKKKAEELKKKQAEEAKRKDEEKKKQAEEG